MPEPSSKISTHLWSDEAELVRRCIEKPLYLRELLAHYSQPIRDGVRRALKRHSSPCHLAEEDDLFADFAVRLLARPDSLLANFDPCRGTLGAYLHGVAVYTTRDALRAQRYRPCTPKAETGDRRHSDRSADDVLDHLTPEEAWILRAYFGLAPFREHKSANWLAKALCCGKRTVYRKVAELLRQCRENAYWDDCP